MPYAVAAPGTRPGRINNLEVGEPTMKKETKNMRFAGQGAEVLKLNAWRRATRAAGLTLCLGGAVMLAACNSGSSGDDATEPAPTPEQPVSGVYDKDLAFDASNYTKLTVSVDGEAVPVRWYKEVCYVAKPTTIKERVAGGPPVNIENPECGFQSMNVFVPESVAEKQDNAIYFAVSNSGWFSSYVGASIKEGDEFDSATSNVGAALKAGYVFINVGSRSRGLIATDDTYPGKAPAVVVDAKAAIRYLRLNDDAMPGSAERIVINGTSGGGAMVSIVGASGNSADYLPYLDAAGAAGISENGESTLRDDVLAVVSYCPITDLGNADLSYEWLYTKLDTRALAGQDPNPQGSAELAAKFKSYQQGLGLKNADGQPLTEANMLDTIRQEVVRSAEVFMSNGGVIPAFGDTWSDDNSINDWIHVDAQTGKVSDIDMERYLLYVVNKRALKTAPAFDQKGLTVTKAEGESNLFGTPEQLYSNFTEYAWDNNDVPGDGIGLDDTGLSWRQHIAREPGNVLVEQLKLVNPMEYIGTDADTSPYWYVRHGTLDRDTSFVISLNLSRALQADAKVRDVDYRLAWHTGHAGNYDVPEAMGWVAEKLKQADAAR